MREGTACYNHGNMLILKKLAALSARKRALAGLASAVLALVLLAGLGNGYLQYSVAYVACGGRPISASSFAASYSYELPGESGYGPRVFNRYFCTEQQAKAAGFRHSVLTAGGSAEQKAQQEKTIEDAAFSLDKISFDFYVPSGVYSAGSITVSKMNSGDNQAFFSLKKEGSKVGRVREGKVPNEYQLCRDQAYECTNIGADHQGRSVQKQTANEAVTSYMVVIGETFINIEDASGIGDEEAVLVFNSLVNYENEK